MDHLSDKEIKKLKNQFEIEERVINQLRHQDDIDYYNSKLRRTSSNQFAKEERLKSSIQREQHWNKLANDIATNKVKENNIEMAEHSATAPTQAAKKNEMMQLAEVLTEAFSSKSKNNDTFDFIEKPKKYDGSRDPLVIES